MPFISLLNRRLGATSRQLNIIAAGDTAVDELVNVDHTVGVIGERDGVWVWVPMAMGAAVFVARVEDAADVQADR